LDDPVTDSSQIGDGLKLGLVHKECFGVNHVHMEFMNYQLGYSCYYDKSTDKYTAGMFLNEGDPIGKFYTNNTTSKHRCSLPTNTPTPMPTVLPVNNSTLQNPGGKDLQKTDPIQVLQNVQAPLEGGLRVHITQIDTVKFPQVVLYITALDSKNQPVLNLTNKNISLTENGRIINADMRVKKEIRPIYSSLVVDISGSMGGRTASRRQKCHPTVYSSN
jgi:hypothetical protein